MKTVILCGGMGTRIRDVSETVPKPMIPIGSQPILWHIMKLYGHHGFTQFILATGYRGSVIKDYFLNYYAQINDVTVDLSRPNAVRYHSTERDENWLVTVAYTGVHSNTGTRVARIAAYLEDDPDFMLTYGDGLADIDLRRLVAFHRSHGKLVTVTGVHPSGRFGEMDVDEDHRVRTFAEKPQVSTGRINGGFMVLRREFIDQYLSDDPSLVLERAPLRRCAQDGEMVSYNHDGYWQPMDTQREYGLLNDLWESGQAPWKVWS